MTKQFTSPTAFKASLEARLRARAAELAVPFQTLQMKFVMERLVARLFHAADAPWLLKGGFAMDLRFRPKARTTKDIDLSVTLVSGRASAKFRDRHQAAADTDLGDHLSFRIGELKAELTNAAARRREVPVRGGAGGEGVRHRTDCRPAGIPMRLGSVRDGPTGGLTAGRGGGDRAGIAS